MRLRASLALALVVAVGCKKDQERKPAPASGSATASGSGSAAGSSSGHGSGNMLVPHDVPLTGPALAEQYLECARHLNEGHIDEVKGHCIDPEVVVHEMDFSVHQGLESLLGYLQSMRAAMPDFKQEPQLILVSGRAIVAVNFVHGTHTGPLESHDGKIIPATNKTVGVLSYDHVLTNQQNRTIEKWELMDHNMLLGQLGIASDLPARSPIEKGWAGAPIVLVAKDDPAERANIDLITKQMDAFNAGKTADMAALWTDDVVESDQGADKDHKGTAEVENDLKALLAAFPDAKATNTYVFASGDYVVAEGRLTGTHKGPFGTLKATQRQVDVGYADLYKVKNGKIAEMWRFRDSHALIEQLTGKQHSAPKGGGGPAKKDAPKHGGAPTH